MYAEAVLRGGGGDKAKALDLVNKIRKELIEAKTEILEKANLL
ncbi:hypothetical protein MWN40_10015 [Ornithobacterium rhinotracheale]|nr:hypothetical protein [Ornithobacterium rhinotracheale]MCK0206062.1 hypothetical protein [Ornithobacterium rhinotracheale]